MPGLLSIYHRLPYPLRSLAASLRGFSNARLRYSAEIERLVAEAADRETWTAEQWQAYQSERTAEMLEWAAARVPYYREQWAARRRAGDRAAVDTLANWPLLFKDPLRHSPRIFIADGYDPRRLTVEHTSGSSGTPLALYSDKAAQQAWYALFEQRTRRWNGVRREDRWAMIGGQQVAAFAQTRPPFWVWNAPGRQLYLSAYHIKEENAAAYAAALNRHAITYLLGYPSAMAALAQLFEKQKLDVPALTVVISNAEPIYADQRELLGRVFRCPVIDTYGMAEMATGASECAYGRLHLWPEAGVTGVIADEFDERVPAGEPGRLVLTGLLNRAMPLVRYVVGDRGRLAAGEEACTCGRTLPVLAGVEGRSDDTILTPDGRRVGRLAHLINFGVPVREAQVIQERVDCLRVLVVSEEGFNEEHAESIRQRVRERVGPVEVQIERVEGIPRGPNGKFKAVVSHLNG